jgi:hypothetical protein
VGKTPNPAYDYDENGKHVESRFRILRDALRRIAAGEGYYGIQAREYKEIARTALAAVGESVN